MRAKEVEFEVTYIDLRDKPDWFLEISPHGKVPVLKVDDEVLFESSAIAEYLDEVVAPRLHPADPIKRARNRAWTDYVPTFSSAISKIVYAKTKEAMEDGVANVASTVSGESAALRQAAEETGSEVRHLRSEVGELRRALLKLQAQRATNGGEKPTPQKDKNGAAKPRIRGRVIE